MVHHITPLSEGESSILGLHCTRQAEERLAVGPWWDDYGLVFPSTAGTPVSHRNLIRQLKSLVAQTDLPEIRFHDLRHTCATMLLEAGTHPKHVQECLGHSSITITLDTYSHALPTSQGEVANALDELLRAQIGILQ